jgi:predicted amino acid dehydrogenase
MIDGGYPKNLDSHFNAEGVYVLKGGIVEHSLDIDWRIMNIVNMDVPARQLFACFAESMLLEFEKWYTNFSWGPQPNHPRKDGYDWPIFRTSWLSSIAPAQFSLSRI